MILIIGGAYQGKLGYVLKNYDVSLVDIGDGDKHSLKEIIKFKVINKFHLTIKNFCEIGSEKEFVDFFLKNAKAEIIITDEMGSGVVPSGISQRNYRERVGRVITELAINADVVLRITCGLAIRLK